MPVELAGQPGTRAPHVWLERGGQRLSTIDLFGRGFVLLTGPDGDAWVDAARSQDGIALDAYRIGDGGDLADPEGHWAAAYGVTDGGAVLVRPDGFVAWRTERAAEDPASGQSSAHGRARPRMGIDSSLIVHRGRAVKAWSGNQHTGTPRRRTLPGFTHSPIYRPMGVWRLVRARLREEGSS